MAVHPAGCELRISENYRFAEFGSVIYRLSTYRILQLYDKFEFIESIKWHASLLEPVDFQNVHVSRHALSRSTYLLGAAAERVQPHSVGLSGHIRSVTAPSAPTYAQPVGEENGSAGI